MPPSLSVPTTVTPGSSFGEAWRRRLDASPHEAAATAFRVSPGDALVVVVAHPDDETLAMGAALARLGRDGVLVHVLVGSRGEAALDHVGVEAPGLAERRCAELRTATRALGVASTEVLGLPDGSLGSHGDAVRDAAESAGRAHGAAMVATLWREDPHPDHRAVSAARWFRCAATRRRGGPSGRRSPATAPRRSRSPRASRRCCPRRCSRSPTSTSYARDPRA